MTRPVSTSAPADSSGTADSTAAASREPEIHHSHRDVGGGWLRPAVFGAMDGLVTNVALICGVAAGSSRTHLVVLTGLAGLLAGAFSMAVGEWTSVHSQRALVQAEIDKERREIARVPEAEQAELAALFRHRGLTPELAAEVAAQLSQDPELIWRIHVREELGVDPDALASPYVAAGSSLASFAVGAFLPLLPWLLGATTLTWTLAIAAVALLALGASVARVTCGSAWVGAVRHLALGAAAAGITYGVGSLVGAGVG